MTCPDSKCREELIGMINTKTKEIRCTLSTKVSVRVLCWALVVLFSCIGMVAGITYTAYSNGQKEKERQIETCGKATQTLSTGIAVMQRDIENIKDQLKKQGVSQEKMLEILMDLKKRETDR